MPFTPYEADSPPKMIAAQNCAIVWLYKRTVAVLKIPISGGPHSGKSTLMKVLRAEYPDAYFVSEPADLIVKVEKAKALTFPGYVPIKPLTTFEAFSKLAVNLSVLLESEIPPSAEIVFQDRCLIDNLAYRNMNNYTDEADRLHEKITAANYAFALFCEPVGTYKKSLIREESAEQARVVHEYLRQTYYESGLPIVDLPSFSEMNKEDAIEQRLAIIAQALSETT